MLINIQVPWMVVNIPFAVSHNDVPPPICATHVEMKARGQ